MGQPGFVYVMTNPAMPGLVKIGRSETPLKRADELWTTGVPKAFIVEFASLYKNADEVELEAHHEFAPCRVSSQREFFRVDAETVVEFLLGIVCRDFSFVVAHAVDVMGDRTIDLLCDAGTHVRRVTGRLYPFDAILYAIHSASPEVIESLFEGCNIPAVLMEGA